LNVTSETSQGPVIQEPPTITVQTPPLHFAAPELEKQPPPQTLIPESQPQNVEISQPEPNNTVHTQTQKDITEQPTIIVETLDNDSPTASYPTSPCPSCFNDTFCFEVTIRLSVSY
jgi:hypothetical protein